MSDDPERLELGGLYADRLPSPTLEERVVQDWAQVTRPGTRRPSPTRWGLRIAASAVLFAAGWSAARSSAPTAASPLSSGERYLLLLWEAPGFAASAPPGSVRREYAAWAREVAAAGVTLTGSELGRTRTWVAPTDGPSAPPGIGESRVAGYFVIEAESRAEALRIARSLPHAGHGGWIEVADLVEGG